MAADDRGRRYGDADGYDNYMGGWSAVLAPLFLDFVDVAGGAPMIVDLGCGTGNLLAELARRCPGARLIGVDPSPALLGKARTRPELRAVTFMPGTLEQLPLAEASADAVLSLLVLQEFADRTRAVEAMVRLARPGGIVAACQWDFARMPVIAALVEALAEIDASVGARVSSSTPAAFTGVGELSRCWTHAGLIEVRTGRIAVARRFTSFDELWQPLLAGSTPSTLALAALPAERREAVRDSMQARFAAASQGGAIEISAQAMVVSGIRPR